MTPQEIYIKQLQKNLATQLKEKDVMKGFIRYQSDRCRWAVVWWDTEANKKRFITRYKGELIPCTAFKTERGVPLLDENGRLIPDKTKCQGYARAERLLREMQIRQEQADRGECKFRIEEFTKANFIAVADAYQSWIDEALVGSRKPATIKGYRSYLRTWIEPWFKKHPIPLHEVDLGTLMSFLKHIRTTLRENNKDGNVGKTALNIMSSVHSAMDHAKRMGRLKEIPPFPKLEDYDLRRKKIEWLDKKDAAKVFEKIPAENRPIFEWLKLHFRRPGEACALYKTDYDVVRQSFTIQRALSARKVVESVKTNWKDPTIHITSCHADFIAIAERLLNQNTDSPYMFVNPRARKDGGRYTLESLRNVWYKACDDASVPRIWTYNGVKHTACTHFMEDGGTEVELQKLTGHKNLKSLEKYREITVERIRRVQEDAKRRAEEAEKKSKETERSAQNGAKVISLFRKDE